jgi:trigger factor
LPLRFFVYNYIGGRHSVIKKKIGQYYQLMPVVSWGGAKMNVNLEHLENSRVKVTVEVDAAKLEEGLAHAYRRVAKRVQIRGFRKGKAPRKIIERYYGASIFYEDALDYLVPQLYEAAVEQTKINPVDQPSCDIHKIEPGEGLSIEFEVDIYPEVELGQYTGLPVEKRIREVTAADIDAELEQLHLQHGELVSVEDRNQVQEGDYVDLDFKGFLEGKPFPGGAASGYTLRIGSGQFIPGFEEQLIGLSIDEEKEVDVTFPEDYHAQELAGKDVTFVVKINGIKKRVLPELNDDFAKDLGDYESLAELKEDIRKRLEERITHGTKHEMENRLIEQIIGSSTIVLPKSMIDQQLDYMMNQFETNLLYSGMTLERYLEHTQKTQEELRGEMEPEAVNQLKRGLILDAIAEKEGISASDEEIDRKIDELAQDSPDPEQARANMESSRNRLANMIRIDKTWDFLIANAQVTEVADEIADSADTGTKGAEPVDDNGPETE